MELTQEMILSVGGIITVLGGAWITIRKILRDIDKDKKRRAAEILQEAKAEDLAIKLNLESKINDLESKISNIEINIEKDVRYLKESYSAELKNLGEKIENLRTELSNQHSSLLSLLTKLIEK